MTSLVALVFPDETTASAAAEDVRSMSDLMFRKGAIAVISRDVEGTFSVMTSYSEASGGVSRSLAWTLLFGELLFDSADLRPRSLPELRPDFRRYGSVVQDVASGAFKPEVRELLQPGSSAVFLMVDESLIPRLFAQLNRFGGAALQVQLGEAIP
ncbi:MAG TPA: hypothetical protein VI248_06770 [Kineosporiaceae bacterium]